MVLKASHMSCVVQSWRRRLKSAHEDKHAVMKSAVSKKRVVFGECTLVPVFGTGGTSKCTLVPVFGTGEHPPKPPFWKPPFCEPPIKLLHFANCKVQ